MWVGCQWVRSAPMFYEAPRATVTVTAMRLFEAGLIALEALHFAHLRELLRVMLPHAPTGAESWEGAQF